MRTLIVLLFLPVFTYSVVAQVVPPPQNIKASDDKVDHIDITWNAVLGYKNYTVFRGESRDIRLMRPLSKTLQSDRFQDRDGLKTGKRYFYAVRTVLNGQQSALSNVDDGRLLLVANDGDTLTKTLSEVDCLPLSIESADSSNTGYIDLTYLLSNTCEKNFTAQNLSFYASKDATFDANDALLMDKKTNPFPIDATQRGAVRLTLPLGIWYIFVQRGKTDKPLMRKIVMVKNN
jgi:hypothetical protein